MTLRVGIVETMSMCPSFVQFICAMGIGNKAAIMTAQSIAEKGKSSFGYQSRAMYKKSAFVANWNAMMLSGLTVAASHRCIIDNAVDKLFRVSHFSASQLSLISKKRKQ